MNIVTRKICVIGDFGVGKTSLITRFVRNTFSENYLTTVGVKVDSRNVRLNEDCEFKLVIWDLAGNPQLAKLNKQYIKGSHGFIFVVDGTRHETLQITMDLMRSAHQIVGPVPSILLLNKVDLINRWAISIDEIENANRLLPSFRTSALNGEAVEPAFLGLARQLAGEDQ